MVRRCRSRRRRWRRSPPAARSSTRWPPTSCRTTASRPASARSRRCTSRSERRLELQRGLIRSHAAGSGDEVEREVVRALMLLRLSTLATGRTGVRPVVASSYAAMLSAGITPVVHEYGSLGCSGDLAPLVALRAGADGRGAGARRVRRAARRRRSRCARPGIEPVVLHEKEGLALINGTDGMLGMLVLAIADLRRLLVTADITAAMSVEGLLGTDRVFAADLHALRPQTGPGRGGGEPARAAGGQPDRRLPPRAGGHARAGRLLAALRAAGRRRGARHASRTPRWSPTRELASAIDNPVVTADGRVESNGNFHGAPVGYVLDFLAIAAADLASMSERRTDRFLDVVAQPRPAAVPGRRSGRRLRLHDRPVHAGGDRLRAQAARRARERGLDPELRDAGGPRLDGLVRRRASCAARWTG